MGGGFKLIHFNKDEFMKKTILAAAALCATCLSANTFAQAQNFEGFALSAATGFQKTSVKLDSWSMPTISSNSDDISSVPLMLGGEYTWALNNQYTLGLGLEYNPLASSEATWRLRESISGASEVGKSKISNTTGVYLKPGMAIDKDTLIYAKLGYFSAKTSTTDSSGVTESSNVNAYTIGVGYRKDFSKAVFAFGEASALSGISKDQTVPDNTPAIKYKSTPSGTTLLLGIGYRF
jgi:hypothetical protein